MIYTERVINVKNGVATIDQPIVLFRGDRNIEIVFEIVNSKFKFSEKGNYILDIGAKYGQLAVEMPDGTDLFTDIAECLDGKVIFKITGDMINEIAENGYYSFHVRLFNGDKTSRVTIPPIMEGIEIREPIVIEGDAIFPIVDMGGADIAPIDSDEETFIDENGKLDIQWQTGDIISSTRLNQMVEFINIMEEKLVSEDNLKDYATIEHVDTNFYEINNELDIVGRIATEAQIKADNATSEINSKLGQYDNFINDTTNMLERHDEEINEARTYADAANQSVLSLNREVSTHRSNITSLDGRVTNIENQIADVGLDMLREDLEGAVKQIEDINGELSNRPTFDELTHVDEAIEDHNARLEVLEQAEAPDLSIYATTEYVDNEINEYVDTMNHLSLRVSNASAGISDLTDVCIEHDNRIIAIENILDDFDNADGIYDIASKTYVDERIGELQTDMDGYVADIVQGKMSDYGLDNIDEELSNRPKWEELTYIDEAIDDHITRIEALENSQTNPEAPDLSGYVTKEYLESNYFSKMQTHASFTIDAEVDKKIDDAIGNINDILDVINGEEI